MLHKYSNVQNKTRKKELNAKKMESCQNILFNSIINSSLYKFISFHCFLFISLFKSYSNLNYSFLIHYHYFLTIHYSRH
jgi:hypothetical protein